MTSGLLRRAPVPVLGLLVVAALAYGAWKVSYARALDGLAQRGWSDLALTTDRLTGQLQRYQDLAVMLVTHPALVGRLDGSVPQGEADALLLRAADRTGVMNMAYVDAEGHVLAAARPVPDSALPRSPAMPAYVRAITGALGTAHGIDPFLDRRAYYFAAPSFAVGGGVTGALLVAVNIDALEQEWRGERPAVFFTDTTGEVFVTNRSEILFWRRPEGSPGLVPATGPAPPFRAEITGRGEELWHTDWGVYLPRTGLHLARDLPKIGLTGEALIETAPVRRIAALQAALVGLAGLAALGTFLWASQRRRVLARANALLETRVAARTAELSGTNLQLRREVAERQEAEAALKKAQADLVQAGKLSALGQMSAGISHELNQPLMAIRQFAENGTLLMDRGRTEAAAQNLSRISELAERMGRIIRNLRAFAKQESSPVRPIDLTRAVETALEMTEARRAREGVTLDWSAPAGPVMALGGEVRLGQVLLNLITNALDAMQGRETRHLTVAIDRGIGGRHRIRVADTGPGIAAPERIFDPFYTTKEVAAPEADGTGEEGMGLGLSISYGLVQSFGGRIRGRNRPEGGAEFTVELDRAPQEAAA